MMPPPMIGPRGTSANSGTVENSSRKAATTIELAKLPLLRTAFSFSGCPAGTVASYQGIALAIS
jgi:hypothetical protein